MVVCEGMRDGCCKVMIGGGGGGEGMIDGVGEMVIGGSGEVMIGDGGEMMIGSCGGGGGGEGMSVYVCGEERSKKNGKRERRGQLKGGEGG